MFGSIFLKDDQLQRGLTNAERSGQRTTGVLGRGFSQVGLSAAGLGSTIGGVAIAMAGMAGIAVGVGAAVAGVVSAGASYEAQMSKVKAISGANGKEFEMLKAQAKQLGSDTKYSATEAAEGMEFLARAGFKTGDIMKAMPGMLDLAAAGALDLGQAADISSNIMSGFGIEAGKAGHVSDVLAKAAASANTDVSQLGEAMKYLAPTAKSVGWSMEESTAAVMALSDAGIQGSLAGQAFGSSLTRLASPTKKMHKVMDSLNLSFFDSSGVMKPLPQLVGELQQKTSGLTMEQKASALSTLFGAEAYKHWAVLIDKGGDALGKNTEMLKNADGAAKQMADTMNNNLSGAWKGFESKLETLAITIYEKISPALQALVNFGSDVVSGFTKMISSSSDFTKGFSKAFEGIGTALSSVKNVIAHHFNAMVMIFQKHQGAILNIWNFLWDSLGPQVVKTVKLIAGIIDTALTLFRNTINFFMSLLSGDWKGAWESFKNLTSDLIEGLSEIIFILWDGSILQKLVQLIKDGAIWIGNALLDWGVAIKDWFVSLPSNIVQWLPQWWNAISTWVVAKTSEWKNKLFIWGTAIKKWFLDLPNNIGNWLSYWWNAISTWVVAKANKWGLKLLSWHVAIQKWFVNLPNNIADWLSKWWNTISSWTIVKASEWGPKLFSWGTAIKDWFLNIPSKIAVWLSEWWDTISTWVVSKANEWGYKLLAWGIAIKDWFISLPDNISEWISNWWNTILNWLVEKQTAWSLQLSSWGNAIQEWFSSLPEIISQKLTEWWNTISNWFESTKESWKTKLDEWNVTIGEWFEKLPENIYNWLLNVSQILEQWNNEQIQKIKDDFNAWWASIEDWFNSTKENWATKLNEWGAIISQWWESIPSRIKDWFNGWWSPISEWYDSTKTQIENKLNEWGNSISAWWESIPSRISDWFTNWWNSMSNWYDETKGNIENKLSDWGNSISNWFNTRPAEIRNSLNEWWNSMGKWWDETKQNIKDKLEGWWQAIKDWFTQVPEKPEIKNAGKNMIDRMADGANSKEGDFTEKLGKLILKVIGLVLLAIAIGLFSAGKELIKLILEGVEAARGWMIDKFKEVGKWAIDSISSIDWAGMGKKLINWIIDGISGMAGELGSAFSRLFKGIHIPTPKFSVSGSLNPVDWASGGLPSIGVKWAANGALIKPGNPTLIGVKSSPVVEKSAA